MEQHNLVGRSVGNTNGKELWCMSLRLSQMALYIHNNSHDDQFRNSSNTKGTYYLNNLRGYRVFVTDEMDLGCTPLGWSHVA
jgi:hypothetical protein